MIDGDLPGLSIDRGGGLGQPAESPPAWFASYLEILCGFARNGLVSLRDVDGGGRSFVDSDNIVRV